MGNLGLDGDLGDFGPDGDLRDLGREGDLGSDGDLEDFGPDGYLGLRARTWFGTYGDLVPGRGLRHIVIWGQKIGEFRVRGVRSLGGFWVKRAREKDNKIEKGKMY